MTHEFNELIDGNEWFDQQATSAMEEEDGAEDTVTEPTIDVGDEDGSGLADVAERIMETVEDIVNATQVIFVIHSYNMNWSIPWTQHSVLTWFFF